MVDLVDCGTCWFRLGDILTMELVIVCECFGYEYHGMDGNECLKFNGWIEVSIVEYWLDT